MQHLLGLKCRSLGVSLFTMTVSTSQFDSVTVWHIPKHIAVVISNSVQVQRFEFFPPYKQINEVERRQKQQVGVPICFKHVPEYLGVQQNK